MRCKVCAGLLAIFVGNFGIHKFYLGKFWQGLLYVLFCWTLIPGIVGFVEGIYYLLMSDDKFNYLYNGDDCYYD